MCYHFDYINSPKTINKIIEELCNDGCHLNNDIKAGLLSGMKLIFGNWNTNLCNCLVPFCECLVTLLVTVLSIT